MMMQYSATLTTDGSGNLTTYVGSKIKGWLHAIKWAHGGITSTPIVISGETTEVPILTETLGDADTWRHPVAVCHTVAAGAASTITEARVWLHGERIKIVIASGTASQSGVITFYIEEI